MFPLNTLRLIIVPKNAGDMRQKRHQRSSAILEIGRNRKVINLKLQTFAAPVLFRKVI